MDISLNLGKPIHVIITTLHVYNHCEIFTLYCIFQVKGTLASKTQSYVTVVPKAHTSAVKKVVLF